VSPISTTLKREYVILRGLEPQAEAVREGGHVVVQVAERKPAR